MWFQLNQQQKDAVLELERSNSERIVAVVGGALLDQSLQVAVELRMRQDKDALRKVFKPNGPMGGQNKVDLGYLLYMYEKDVRDVLTAIFTIRNYFAHNLTMSFDTDHPEMVKALSLLTLHHQNANYPDPSDTGSMDDAPIGIVESNKDRFIANLKIALILLARDHDAHLPYQNTPMAMVRAKR
jgi:hypothetical protein